MQMTLREKEQLTAKNNKLEEQIHLLKSEKEKIELKYQ